MLKGTLEESKIVLQKEKSSLYEYLTDKLNHHILKNIIIKNFRKDELIYFPGESNLPIFEILSGGVLLGYYTEEGEEITHEILVKYDYFGNLKNYQSGMSEFAKALIDTTVVVYNHSYFNTLVGSDIIISGWFNKYLSRRWSDIEVRLLKINSQKVVDNLVYLYRNLNKKVKDAHGREFLIFDLLTKKEIADLIGCTRQTVASALKELKIT